MPTRLTSSGHGLWVFLPLLLVILLPFLFILPGDRTASAQNPEPTISWDQGVTEADIQLVTEAVGLAESSIGRMLGWQIDRPLAVHIGESVEVTDETFGIYRDDTFLIWSGSAVWRSRSQSERIQVIVHEYVHFYLDPAPLPNSRPIWLEEGLAEYLAWHILDDLGVIDHPEILSYFAAHVRIWPNGEALCSMTPLSISGIDYPLAYLGAAVLVNRAGLGAIAEYRNEMVAGTPHDLAFRLAFQMSEVEFCGNVNSEVARIIPASSKPSAFLVSDQPANGTYATISNAPFAIAAGEQVLVVASTNEFATCALAVDQPNAGGDGELVSVADGAGTAYWLFSIPLTAEAGPITFAVRCGAGSDEHVGHVVLRRKAIEAGEPRNGA